MQIIKFIKTLESFIVICVSNRIYNLFIIFAFIIAMSISFYNNGLGIVTNKDWFKAFGNDVESHIPATILANKYDIDTQGYGLMILNDDRVNDTYGLGALRMLKNDMRPQDFYPYRSSIGIQGFLWTWLYGMLGSFEALHILNSILSSVAIMLTSIMLARIFGNLFGVVFFISMFFSPWITVFGNNLYWSLWIWFLPAICSYYIYIYIYI